LGGGWLTALTLLHRSECSSVTDDGMRPVAISLTHIESAGTPARVREVHCRVVSGCGVYDTAVQRGGWSCSTVVIAAGVTRLG
jgi:hypothetical protein